jgi:hypothetical protein
LTHGRRRSGPAGHQVGPEVLVGRWALGPVRSQGVHITERGGIVDPHRGPQLDEQCRGVEVAVPQRRAQRVHIVARS